MKIWFIFGSLILAFAGQACAQSRGSLVDDLKGRGMAADYGSRAKIYREQFGGDPYRGTAEQNERLRRNLGGNSTPGSNRSTAKPTWLSESEWDTYRREECRPKLDKKKSADSYLLDQIGYDDSSCCGSSRRCEHVSDLCVERDPRMQGPQQRACWRHDKELDRLGRDFTDPHPDVQAAHRRLEDESTDPLIAAPFKAMRKARETKREIEEFSRDVRRRIDELLDF